MAPEDFKTYFKTPSKLEKSALQIAEQLFCYPRCTPNCLNNCVIHPLARTLKTKYVSNNQHIVVRTPNNPPQAPNPQLQYHPNPPPHIINNPIRFGINIVLDHKINVSKDKYKITKNYNTYLCQWNTRNHDTYTKWMLQRDLFPHNYPSTVTHNIALLTNYYKQLQHKHYTNIINQYFTPSQPKDTRFIPPPSILLHTQISIRECNPDKDITTRKPAQCDRM